MHQSVEDGVGERVAEVTGRSRRIVKHCEAECERLAVETRPASANLSEAQSFMDDEKRVLVFSDAGGTGRSYHADLGANNQRRRIHYLLEAGWRADTAIQGLGRSNRTNQKQPPVFRPVTSDVKAEKRFLSTIARRLDTLGAITRGARATGGQGMFRAEDNLESAYARAALRDFFQHLHASQIAACSADEFEAATGLTLTQEGGGLKEDLPPISQFLNRMLALKIDLQNRLFEVFEALLERGFVMRQTASDTARALARCAETVCRHYLANGRRTGGYWIVGDIFNTPGRSLFVRLHGPECGPGASGNWTDAATGEHGDLLDLIRLASGLTSLKDAIEEAWRFLSLPPPITRSIPRPPRIPSVSTMEAARRLYAGTQPLKGTRAETYLRARGIDHHLIATPLRFHPRLLYRGGKAIRAFPGLVAAVTDAHSCVTGVQRLFLDPKHSRKADVEDRRMSGATACA